MQEVLAMLDDLVFARNRAQEKLAPMSIHEKIRAAREKRGWSMEDLAAEVSRHEGLAKPLAWQTVQQWENGGSAPRRKRMQAVADALGIDLSDLVGAATAPESLPPAVQAFAQLCELADESTQALALEAARAVFHAAPKASPNDSKALQKATTAFAALSEEEAIQLYVRLTGPAVDDGEVERRMPVTKRSRHT